MNCSRLALHCHVDHALSFWPHPVMATTPCHFDRREKSHWDPSSLRSVGMTKRRHFVISIALCHLDRTLPFRHTHVISTGGKLIEIPRRFTLSGWQRWRLEKTSFWALRVPPADSYKPAFSDATINWSNLPSNTAPVFLVSIPVRKSLILASSNT